MAQTPDPFGMTCVVNTVGLIAIIVNTCIVVRYGKRRILLMCGMTICGILQLIVAVVYDKVPNTKVAGKVLIALTSLYMMTYCVSPHLHLPASGDNRFRTGN